MSITKKNLARTIQRFEPGPNAVYTLETTAHLAQVTRHAILVYYKHGLVSPVADPADAGYYFNDEAIHELRRIEFLRAECGFNLQRTQMVLALIKEVERLRAELRFARG